MYVICPQYTNKICVNQLFCSVFKRMIPDAITIYFQEVCGITQPLIFHQRQMFSHGIMLSTAKLILVYTQGILTIVFATVFN